MRGSTESVSAHAVAPVELKYSPAQDDFSLPNCRAHTIRKANYKSLGNGQLVPMGWKSRMKAWVEGNNADQRYHRAAYESSQRVSAAIFSENYKSEVKGKAANISDSALVKARFYRQDNLRFNPEFSDPMFGLSKRDQRAVKLSRWAHRANGITELGAAPTGLMLKISKILFMPKRNDKTHASQFRVFAALPVVAGLISLFSLGVFGNKWIYKAFDGVRKSLRDEMRALAVSFSAISAASALISLAFGASSCMLSSKSKLSGAVTDLIQFNRDKHLHRIYLLLKDVHKKPGAIGILSKALQQKIGQSYRTANGTPVLLDRLLNDMNSTKNEAQAKQALEKTIGSYLTESSCTGSTRGQFLDAKSDKAQLLTRENHFLALTNLVEHTAIHEHPDPKFKDLRHRIEGRADVLRKGVVKGSCSLLNVLGYSRKGGKGSSAALKHPDTSLYYNGENILNNPHQYGPLTRGLAKFSEGLRVFNHSVLLSLNYQLTRPIAKLAGFITEAVFKKPNSRVTSFSIGRAIASSIWAAVDALLILPLAAGKGIPFGGPEASSKVTFPLELSFKTFKLPISIVSTATQMLVVAFPALVLMTAAKGACYLEGWNGNVKRPLELPGGNRKATQWA